VTHTSAGRITGFASISLAAFAALAVWAAAGDLLLVWPWSLVWVALAAAPAVLVALAFNRGAVARRKDETS